MAERKASVGRIELQDDNGRRRTIQLDDLNDADRALAEKFGYKPVFKREFGYLSTFSFAVSISGLFATIATTFLYPIEAGGASAAVWCWLISGAGCMCIALSVAELVSAYPTCGGLYYTISRLAPRKYAAGLSWITGWLNLLGQVAGAASSIYGAAQLLLAAVSMGSDFVYQPTTGHTVGVMAGLLIICGLVNSLPTAWMERVTSSYVIFHVLVLISCCIALLVKTENKNTAEYAFTSIYNVSGWSPQGWAWMFGFLSVSWTMTDYDATAHITEEINEPELKAPWAISMAMVFTYVGGFLFNIVLVFCMGQLGTDNDILNSPVQQPVAQIFYNSLGPAGGIFYTVCAVIILMFLGFTAVQALARTLFAFSRDRLVPGSKIWTKINKRTQTPLYAVWISIFFCIAINLIALGSYIAIAGVFNVTAIALDWSYTIPIACKMIFGKFEPGPWHLGKYSWYVNFWAVTWTVFVSIIFLCPTTIPTSADTMNYAIAFLGAIFVFAGLSWILGASKYYTGPLVEAEVQENETDSGSEKPAGVDEKGFTEPQYQKSVSRDS